MMLRVLITLMAAIWLTAPGTSRAQSLSADLSDHLIAITTGFTGTDLTLFGATDGDGDVAVVVEGPPADLIIRRKERLAGIWTNRSSARFVDVPTFYYAAATRAPSQFLRQVPREIHRIGVENLTLRTSRPMDEDEAEAFRDALIDNRDAAGLYNRQIGNVTFIGSRLFRADIYFPAEVPTGTYRVRVLLIRGGEVVSQTDTPLTIQKIGTSAQIFDFANEHAAAFGFLAVLFAAAAGWFAAFIFRKS
jgi:Large extracellular alpha-helical protein